MLESDQTHSESRKAKIDFQGWSIFIFLCILYSILLGGLYGISWPFGLATDTIFMATWIIGGIIVHQWSVYIGGPQEEDIEESYPVATDEYVKPTHTNGIPQELYEKGETYAREKVLLDSDKSTLTNSLRTDITNLGTSSATIQKIYQQIREFQSSIVRASDALIDILPEYMDVIENFENREVFYRYLEYLQYEMNSIQQISRDMTSTIQTWMIYNHIEVAQEKQKMEQLITEGQDTISGYMSTLITATEALRARGEERQVEQILIRQRI